MITPDRRAAMTAGILLSAGIVTAVASSAIEHSLLTGTAHLPQISANAARLTAAGLTELAAAGASAGIAIALYPVLRTRSHGLALGAVAFRAIEAAMYAVAAAAPALAVSLGHHGGGPDAYRLPLGRVHQHPRDLLHDLDPPHRRAGDHHGGLAHTPGIQPAARPGTRPHRPCASRQLPRRVTPEPGRLSA